MSQDRGIQDRLWQVVGWVVIAFMLAVIGGGLFYAALS